MLNVTGQRHKNRPTKSVAFAPAIYTGDELENTQHPINQRFISGKSRGALVLVEAAGNRFIPYVATGPNPDDAWVAYSLSGGGGGGGGVTQLALSDAERAITFVDENGVPSKLMYGELKATPMEFYLDVRNPDPSQNVFIDAKQGGEYVVPIGGISLSGRNHYITVDRATNRVLIPSGNLRGTFRLYGAYRFNPSIKDDISIDLIWCCRKQGSNDPWHTIYEINVSRTASQTTSSVSLPNSSAYYNLPDGDLEAEVRLRFNNVGSTGIDWANTPLFTSEDDGIKISLLKNPNYEYVT